MPEERGDDRAAERQARVRHTQVLFCFEEAWQRGERPGIDDYLPPPGDPDRLPVLISLVQIDLERRMRQGEPGQCDQYFRRYPELCGQPDMVANLIAAECALRDRPQLAEPTAPHRKAAGAEG